MNVFDYSFLSYFNTDSHPLVITETNQHAMWKIFTDEEYTQILLFSTLGV